jgi:hypothetical protein
MKIARPLIVTSLVAALAIGTVTPASAAARYHGGALHNQIAQLDRKIDRAESRRIISHREAGQLDRQVDRLEATWRVFSRGGFTRSEVNALNNRIGSVERMLQRAANDHNNRPQKRHTHRPAVYRR